MAQSGGGEPRGLGSAEGQAERGGACGPVEQGDKGGPRVNSKLQLAEVGGTEPEQNKQKVGKAPGPNSGEINIIYSKEVKQSAASWSLLTF